MALIEVPSGLEGVIAFDTSIAEPDREGRLIRPSARYVGPEPRAADSVNGAGPAA